MAVDSYIKRMFGEKSSQFADAKVLLVGAGGIGCELLKDLIMMNIGEIHVLDLDTIDLSNLNRQFLFRHKDIKQSKSKTAIAAVEFFNYKSKLYAYHGSVLDTNLFPLSFFKQFNIIYNALDNLEARFYMNRMCLYLNIPLYESGTTGLKGQVQPIYPYLTECFSCVPKETPKTFPVCTIRSTPSKPVHCITWAKDFLFSQLFSNEDTNTQEIDASEFTNEEEAEASKKEVNELADLKKIIANEGDNEIVIKIFEKIFIADIERLLKIEELWKSREKPSFEPIKDYDHFFKDINKEYLTTCKDQSTLEEILKTFASSLLRLTERFKNNENIEFDKDDEDTLFFVMSASNIRSLIFNISTKNEFDVKQIAGNIIPAVATTNAIMAGFSALSSVNYFLENDNINRVAKSKMVFDSSSTDKVVNSSKLIKPNPSCSACSIVKGIITIDLSSTTLGQLRDKLIEKYNYGDDVEIMTLDSRLLYDFDLEDNLEEKLTNFINDQTVLLINDSDEKFDLIELYVLNSPNSEIIFPELNIPLKKIKPSEIENDENDDGDKLLVDNEENNDNKVTVSLDDDDDLVEEQPPMKKRKI